VELVTALGRSIPFAFASGVNLYATVAVLGLCARYNLVAVPEQFRAFEDPLVIAGAIVLYAIEFVADKIPWVDTIWDAIHSVIRPVGGALVAVTALGDASAGTEALAGLVGGAVALATHLTKAGARAAVNTSPEPFSNWFLSLAEDAFVVGLSYLALQHPYIALAVVTLLLTLIAIFASVVMRWARRRFAARRAAA
jgi:hypothetical protein